MQERAVLIAEFELARGHVLFTLAMKLQPLTIPPGLVLASAHHSPVKARQALGRVLPSTCRHPQILALQAKPLVDQAKAFLAGTSLKDLPEFEEYVAAKKFGWNSEYECEGLHARVERTCGGVVARKQSYDSLVLRLVSWAASCRCAVSGCPILIY